MPEAADARVAVYIDFDNIVISRYHQLYEKDAFFKDKVRSRTTATEPDEITARLANAKVDIGAILDYASSFGSIVISRAYADWSVAVNASYKNQLIDRAVDLTQMFPTVLSMKNGADIRLAVDVVVDLFRLPDITHVVIVAGDSDYIALAQRSKRLGRFVVGIGVAGSTSRSLAAACDVFADYDALPGLELEPATQSSPPRRPGVTSDGTPDSPQKKAASTTRKSASIPPAAPKDQINDPKQARRDLLRAMHLVTSQDDADWILSTTVKNQMLRMNPAFNEKSLGYKNFSDFVKANNNLVELAEDGQIRRLRLRVAAGK